MTDGPQRRMVEEFLSWDERQDARRELMDGRPVAMAAGAPNVHDDIVVNVPAALGVQLWGRDCQPFTGAGSVEPDRGRSAVPTSASTVAAGNWTR